jgi:hypothetical protein
MIGKLEEKRVSPDWVVGEILCLIVRERFAQARCGYDGYDKSSQGFGISGWGERLHEPKSDSPDGSRAWKAMPRAESYGKPPKS